MRSVGFVAAAAACLIAPLAAQALAQATPSAAEAVQVSRRQTVEDLATKLVNRFVKPDVGQKYAAMLRANAAAGKYDGLTDDAAFAKQVTADIQAVSFDGHLQLGAGEEAGWRRSGGGGGEVPAASPIRLRRRPGSATSPTFASPNSSASLRRSPRSRNSSRTMPMPRR